MALYLPRCYGEPRRRMAYGSAPHSPFTLPDRQARLDALDIRESLQLARDDFERLFGVNDAAFGRLRGFAESHNSMTTHRHSGIGFVQTPGSALDASGLGSESE